MFGFFIFVGNFSLYEHVTFYFLYSFISDDSFSFMSRALCSFTKPINAAKVVVFAPVHLSA